MFRLDIQHTQVPWHLPPMTKSLRGAGRKGNDVGRLPSIDRQDSFSQGHESILG
jgi:hypothetical protein